MISAISTALGGIQSATTRFEKAASDVATAGVGPQGGGAEQSQGQTSGRPIDRSAPLGASGSFAGPLIEAKLAEVSYKANIAVLRVADSLSEELLNIKA